MDKKEELIYQKIYDLSERLSYCSTTPDIPTTIKWEKHQIRDLMEAAGRYLSVVDFSPEEIYAIKRVILQNINPVNKGKQAIDIMVSGIAAGYAIYKTRLMIYNSATTSQYYIVKNEKLYAKTPIGDICLDDISNIK